MYTNKQRLTFTEIMKDVNMPEYNRQGVGDWSSLALSANVTKNAMASNVQFYQKGEQTVVAIQDLDFLEDVTFQDLQSKDTYTKEDLSSLVNLLHGNFSDEFTDVIRLVHQQIQEYEINPEKITFVGSGVGGAHAQILAETFGSHLFTHDAPGVASLMDDKGILFSQTYDEVLRNIGLEKQGVLTSQNIVENGSDMSSGGRYFDDDDYIGEVIKIDSATNKFSTLTSVLRLGDVPKIKKEPAESKGRNKTDKVPSKIQGLRGVLTKGAGRAVVTARVISYGTQAYDLMAEEANHDLDVLLNYLEDISKSQADIEQLVLESYATLGIETGVDVNPHLLALAEEVYQNNESLMYFDYQNMMDTIATDMSNLLLELEVIDKPTLVEPLNFVLSNIDAPVVSILEQIEKSEFSTGITVIDDLTQEVVQKGLSTEYEPEPVIRALDHFLRREFSTSLPEVDAKLVDAANVIKDNYVAALDKGEEIVEDFLELAGEKASEYIQSADNLYESFKGYFQEKMDDYVNLVQELREEPTTLSKDDVSLSQGEIEGLMLLLQQQTDLIYEMQNTINEYAELISQQAKVEDIQSQTFNVTSQFSDGWATFSKQISALIDNLPSIQQATDLTVGAQGVANAVESNLLQITFDISFILNTQGQNEQAKLLDETVKTISANKQDINISINSFISDKQSLNELKEELSEEENLTSDEEQNAQLIQELRVGM